MGFVRTAAWKTQIQEVFELCCIGLQNGGVYTGKTCKATVSHMNCVSRIMIGAGKKVRVLNVHLTQFLYT